MKYFIVIIVLFTLGACGQGKEDELQTGYLGDQSNYEVEIPVQSENEAVRVVRDFFANELDELAFSGLFLERDPKTHLVTLIQDQYLNEAVATELLAFAEKNSQNQNSGSKFLVKLKPAKYSYKTLDTIMNKLNSSHEKLLVTDRKVLSFGINEMENRIDLHVSTKADLNEELLNEITEGNDSVIHITEGIMSMVDENGIPTTEPYIIGAIMEFDTEHRKILIEDQIYFSMNDATNVFDSQGNPIQEIELKVGDQVAVWTDGAILESLPAQGYAVVIQLQ